MKFLSYAFLIAAIHGLTLTAEATTQCSKLNAWARFEDIANQVCVSYTSLQAGNQASIQLFRDEVVLFETTAAIRQHEGGTSCNRHTGDCSNYPPYLQITWTGDLFSGEINLHRTLSGDIWNEAHNRFKQNLIGPF